jgi:hypothetical protein
VGGMGRSSAGSGNFQSSYTKVTFQIDKSYGNLFLFVFQEQRDFLPSFWGGMNK